MVLALLTVHVSNGCTELVLSRSQHYLWCFDTLFVVLRYTITSVTILAITKRPIQCFKTLKVVFRVVLNVFRNTFFLQCTELYSIEKLIHDAHFAKCLRSLVYSTYNILRQLNYREPSNKY